MTVTADPYPFDFPAKKDMDGGAVYDVKWGVTVDSAQIGPDDVIEAPGLPLPGSPFSSVVAGGNPNAYYFGDGSAKRAGSAKKQRIRWECTLPFRTAGAGTNPSGQTNHPLLKPWKVNGGVNKYTTAAQRDKDGNPILNSAKQRFRGEVVNLIDSRGWFSIEGYVSWINFNVMDNIGGAVNENAYWNIAARKIKVSEFTYEQLWFGNSVWYFKVNFTFEINPSTWDLKPLDEGDLLRIADPYNPGSFTWRVPKDPYENNLHHVLLDGEGGLGDPDSPVYCDGGGAPARPGPFRVRDEVDFATIGFPAHLPGIT